MHIRILNNEHTRLINVKEALKEINHAMMDGKNDVEEMSASGSSATIHYTDGRVVVLRPATNEEIEARAGKEWAHTASNFNLWHRFDGELRALCNRRIRSRNSARVAVKAGRKWVLMDVIGHDELRMTEEASKYGTLCPKCRGK